MVTTAEKMMVAWINKFVQANGQKSVNHGNRIYLGRLSVRRMIYPLYWSKVGAASDLKNRAKGTANMAAYFARVFRNNFTKESTAVKNRLPHVLFYHAEAGKCTECEANIMAMSKGTEREREAAAQRMEAHRAYCCAEALWYAGAKVKGQMGEAVSAGSDATNKRSSAMPIPAAGVTFSCRIPCKITIVILHGHKGSPRHCLRVMSMPWVPMDSDLQNTIWHEATLPALLQPYIDAKKPWPRTYFKQTDRGGDMLNKEAICLEIVNVLKGVFDEVIISCLPVGHSHEGTRTLPADILLIVPVRSPL
jgi:hypothetical protein